VKGSVRGSLILFSETLLSLAKVLSRRWHGWRSRSEGEGPRRLRCPLGSLVEETAKPVKRCGECLCGAAATGEVPRLASGVFKILSRVRVRAPFSRDAVFKLTLCRSGFHPLSADRACTTFIATPRLSFADFSFTRRKCAARRPSRCSVHLDIPTTLARAAMVSLGFVFAFMRMR
jgi:hypothetical protein